MMSRFCSSGPGRCENAVAEASTVTKTTISFFMRVLLENAGVYYILHAQKEGVHGTAKSSRIPGCCCGYAVGHACAGAGPWRTGGTANRIERYVRQHSPGQHREVRFQNVLRGDLEGRRAR